MPPLDFSSLGKRKAQPKPKHNALADFLRFAGAAAPAAGTAIGGVVGAPMAGIGALPGAGIGGAIGTGAGMLAGGGADLLERDQSEADAKRLAEDEEEAARHNAVLRMIGGF